MMNKNEAHKRIHNVLNEEMRICYNLTMVQWSEVCEVLNMINLKWNKYKPSVPFFWLVPGHLSIQVHTRVSQLATQHLTRTGSRNFHSEPAALII